MSGEGAGSGNMHERKAACDCQLPGEKLAAEKSMREEKRKS